MEVGDRIDQYPQEGAFGFGDCPWTDTEARWMERDDIPALQAAPEDTGLGGSEGCGCETAPSPTGMVALLPLLALMRRRQ